METDFIAAYNEVEEQKPNFVQTLEIARSQSRPFLLYSDEHHESALISIMFEAMMDVRERKEFYHSWSDIARGRGMLIISLIQYM